MLIQNLKQIHLGELTLLLILKSSLIGILTQILDADSLSEIDASSDSERSLSGILETNSETDSLRSWTFLLTLKRSLIGILIRNLKRTPLKELDLSSDSEALSDWNSETESGSRLAQGGGYSSDSERRSLSGILKLIPRQTRSRSWTFLLTPEVLSDWDADTNSEADSLKELDLSSDPEALSDSSPRMWTFLLIQKRSLSGMLIRILTLIHSRRWTSLLIQKHLLIEIQTRNLKQTHSVK